MLKLIRAFLTAGVLGCVAESVGKISKMNGGYF
jgi:hypothetical protein